MDILDDFVTFFHTVLHYLGFDVNNLRQIWEPLPSRRNNIRHRSVVRRLGSRLPLQPAKRIRIQNAFLRRSNRLNDSFCSEMSYVSSGGENLVWIEEDIGNNCVMVRPRDKPVDLEDDISPELPDDIEDGLFLPGRDCLMDDRTSTPCDISIGSVSAVSSSDPLTQQKIVALEDELASLRAQIANLILDQEQNKLKPIPFSTDEIMGSGAAPTPPPPPMAPPPPPPPPPPPITPTLKSGTFKKPQAGKSLAELLKSNKENLQNAEIGTGGGKSTGPPNMADILKGLGTVKLRAIQRSPGGTPLKEKAKQSENNDPASLIAQALKKKFANRICRSPGSPLSPNCNENEFLSPDSPVAPFGQHVLKKTQKRSLLFQERRKSSSPLAERNQ